MKSSYFDISVTKIMKLSIKIRIRLCCKHWRATRRRLVAIVPAESFTRSKASVKTIFQDSMCPECPKRGEGNSLIFVNCFLVDNV